MPEVNFVYPVGSPKETPYEKIDLSKDWGWFNVAHEITGENTERFSEGWNVLILERSIIWIANVFTTNSIYFSMTINKDDTLLFVYNADSTFFASLSDFTHKLVAPKTYGCNLCMITYGLFEMKGEWKEFLDTLPQFKTFLHKDEFMKKYPEEVKIPLPAIFVISNGAISELVSAREINQEKDLGGFKNLLLSKMKQ